MYAHLNTVFDIIYQNTLLDFRIGSTSLEGLQDIFHESTIEGKPQLPLVQLCILGGFLVERRLDYCCCNILRKILFGVLSWRIRNVWDALWNCKKIFKMTVEPCFFHITLEGNGMHQHLQFM